jgi:hypothetical protein
VQLYGCCWSSPLTHKAARSSTQALFVCPHHSAMYHDCRLLVHIVPSHDSWSPSRIYLPPTNLYCVVHETIERLRLIFYKRGSGYRGCVCLMGTRKKWVGLWWAKFSSSLLWVKSLGNLKSFLHVLKSSIQCLVIALWWDWEQPGALHLEFKLCSMVFKQVSLRVTLGGLLLPNGLKTLETYSTSRRS